MTRPRGQLQSSQCWRINLANSKDVKVSLSWALFDENHVRASTTCWPSATDTTIARADSPLTLSKSCSDKLALKQCTSLLSSLTSTLISPTNAYLDSLVLPRLQYNQTACERAFGGEGRLKHVANKNWSGGHTFQPFRIRPTDREFSYSRRSKAFPSEPGRGSNISAVYHPKLHETLINGVLQGRKQFDAKGGSALCNARMWQVVVQVAFASTGSSLPEMLFLGRYQQLKESNALEHRREVKKEVRLEALRGWIRNGGDDFKLVHE